MEKFTKEEKELLEQNPNIQAVLSNQVLYTKDFKEKAVIEYESEKSANQIFQEAEIDISKWRAANRKKINIHNSKKEILSLRTRTRRQNPYKQRLYVLFNNNRKQWTKNKMTPVMYRNFLMTS